MHMEDNGVELDKRHSAMQMPTKSGKFNQSTLLNSK